MEYSILIIDEKQQLGADFLSAMKNFSKICYAKDMHDVLYQTTMCFFHLIILVDIQDVEMACKAIETIRVLKNTPILVLLSVEKGEKSLYIEAGADVVLTIGYNDEDIQLQLFALMRRYSKWEINNEEKEKIVQNGSFIMNFPRRKALWKGHEVKLSKHEFNFLYFLASSPERVYTFNQIYQAIWRDYPQGDISNMIWCMVRRIKKKLKNVDPNIPDMIYSVWDTGYVFKMNTETEEKQII